jgi:serpin B
MVRVTQAVFVPVVLLITTASLEAQWKINNRGKDVILDERRSAQLGAQSSNRLGWDLYRQLAKRGGNQVFSPYSVSIGLSMLRSGASGTTAAQMDTAMHGGRFHWVSGMAALQSCLVSSPTQKSPSSIRRKPGGYQLESATALWGQKGLRFEPAFLKVLAGGFGSPLHSVDFKKTSLVRKQINDWVAGKTSQKIQDLLAVGQLKESSQLVLGNAVYFKGTWSDEFDKSDTREERFFGTGGQVSKLPMMRQEEWFRYTDTGDAQVVELPYSSNQASMIVVLPKQRDGLAALEKNLSGKVVSRWLKGLTSTPMSIKLPRFQLNSSLDLVRSLQVLGIVDAFHPQKANFSKMVRNQPILLGSVTHKAYIGVEESGTEAAAATVEEVELSEEEDPPQPVNFHVDHPFLFFIQDKLSGCVLFLGRVCSPSVTSGSEGKRVPPVTRDRAGKGRI